MPALASDVAVRRATPADEPSILRLLRSSLGEEKIAITAEHWRWKHEQNPFGASPVLLAHAGDELVGVRAFMRWRWRSGTSVLEAVRAVDTATHPSWQGRGIFTRLTRALLDELRAEGVPFVFNTPNTQSLPGYLKMGWQVVGRVPVWFRPLRPFRSLLALGRPAVSIEPCSLPCDPAEVVLARPDLDRVLRRRAQASGLHTPLDGAYLAWRYGDAPVAGYGALSSDDALLVARAGVRRGLREVMVTDLVATASARGVVSARALLARLCAAPADYAFAMAPLLSPEALALAAAGFLRVSWVGPRLTVLPLQSGASWVTRGSRWACAAGDLELF